MVSNDLSTGQTNRKLITNLFNLDYREFVTGWGSAFINICITYPINKVIFRQVLDDLTPGKAIRQLSNEGVFILYRGILPPLCQKTTSLALMFGVYEGTRKPLSCHMHPVAAKVTAAMIAGTTEAILTPFERIQSLLQDRRYQVEFRNTKHAFRRIGWEYGVAEAYRGLVPILLRNGPSNVFYFLARDKARAIFHNDSKTWVGKISTEFLYGGLIGGVISTIFYPLNLIKVHMQKQLGGEFQGVISACRQIYSERGQTIACFYRGVHLNYTRGFISWGIITVSAEFIKDFIYYSFKFNNISFMYSSGESLEEIVFHVRPTI